LIDAARALLAARVTPTVEQAAEAASISRTTAYRYFANQRDLLVATYPETEAVSLLEGDAPPDAETRLATVTGSITRQILEHEHELRTQLRLSLDRDVDRRRLPFRQGRAIRWIEDALAPLRDRMSRADLRRLVLAIRAGCGIESFVWLTDVAGLSKEEAGKLMRWSANALLQFALAKSPDRRARKR
jgi:hypothetical protein